MKLGKFLLVVLLFPLLAYSKCAVEGVYQVQNSKPSEILFLQIHSNGDFELRDSIGEVIHYGELDETSPALWTVKSTSISGNLKQTSKSLVLGEQVFFRIPQARQKELVDRFDRNDQPVWVWLSAGAALGLSLFVVTTR